MKLIKLWDDDLKTWEYTATIVYEDIKKAIKELIKNDILCDFELFDELTFFENFSQTELTLPIEDIMIYDTTKKEANSRLSTLKDLFNFFADNSDCENDDIDILINTILLLIDKTIKVDITFTKMKGV